MQMRRIMHRISESTYRNQQLKNALANEQNQTKTLKIEIMCKSIDICNKSAKHHDKKTSEDEWEGKNPFFI